MGPIKHTLTLFLAFTLMLTQIPYYVFAEEVDDPVNEPVLSEDTEAADEEASETSTEETDPGDEEAGDREDTEEASDEEKEDFGEKTADDGENGSRQTEDENGDKKLSDTDCLGYDPLYVEKYANSDYINTEHTDMGSYINVVTAAKGIATYNIAGQKDFEVSESNYLAGMNYEFPVYNVDDNSDYYIALPDVNKFDKDFKAYDIMVAYNNDYGENIKGWKYEKGILYIPKAAIDRPKNKEDAPETALAAVQINYAIGRDMDFSKSIPVQIISNGKPVSRKIRAENIFDLDCVSISTGVKGRKTKDISVFLNGMLIPVNRDSYSYDKGSGVLELKAMPGIISNINIVFEEQSLKEKAVTAASNALSMITYSAYAATLSSMDNLKTASGKEVVLDFDTSKIFVGWRGHYKTKVLHGNSYMENNHNDLDGFDNSIKYLYGGYTSMTGADMSVTSNKEKDAGLAPLWAIQSYAVGGDTGLATNTNNIEYDTPVKHYVTDSSTETHTMYEWLLKYRNKLEKTNDQIVGNGIGGSNNFAAHWPLCKVQGSSTSLTPDKRTNSDISFSSDQISSDQWYAASCSELDDTASSEDDSDVYVTCLEITDEYVVLAFAQARSGQNMCAIYKFKVRPRGYLCIQKKDGGKACAYEKDLPVNYSLKGAAYKLYKNASCTDIAKDINGYDIELVTDESGRTKAVALEPGVYYAKEVTASKGFMFDRPADGVYKGTEVKVSNDANNPAVFVSEEPPSGGDADLKVYKIDPSGKYSWNKLMGAEYKVSYYDVTAKEAISSASPKRSWTFRTRKIEGTSVKGAYYAGFDWQNDDPLEGSDSFYIENGSRIIPCGWFTIQEVNAPSGLALNQEVTYGRVYQKSNGSEAVTEAEGAESNGDAGIDVVVSDAPQRVEIIINKKDASTGSNNARESEDDHSRTRTGRFVSLAGAEYDVYYDDDDLSEPELVGTIVTDENGYGSLTVREKGDERFTGNSLGTGSYFVREVKPAPGFVTDTYVFQSGIQKEASDRDEDVVFSYENGGSTVSGKVSGSFSAGSHYFRTRSLTANTNVFSYTVESKDEPTRTYVSKVDTESGKPVAGAKLRVLAFDEEGNEEVIEEWTSDGNKHLIYELPAGDYLLREVSAPYGYDIADDVEFTVKENVIVTEVEMSNRPVELRTTALDEQNETHHGIFDSGEVITDKVKISGLYKGRTYKVSGKVMDKSSGEALKDEQGNEITAESEPFTASSETEEIEMSFTIDPSAFTSDSAVVVFEKLYRLSSVNDDDVPVELAGHEDINDEDQSIHYGGIASTVATDKDLSGHDIVAKKKTVIVDTVEYSNLSPKETYFIQGTLYDKTAGELTDITANMEFIPASPDGSVQVKFKTDARELEGHSLVVFEYVFSNGNLISKHDDPDNEDQTVYFTASHKSPDTADSNHLALYAIIMAVTMSMLAIAIYHRGRAR